jgi:hypothetical protein
MTRFSGPQDEDIHRRFLAHAEAVPRHLLHRAVGTVKKEYGHLVQRYGPRYARAILVAGLVGLPVPVPFSTVLTAAPVLAVAEVHRVLKRKGITLPGVPAMELTAEHIMTLGQQFMGKLIQDFPRNAEPSGEFEALIRQKEKELARPLTEAEQQQFLLDYLADAEAF